MTNRIIQSSRPIGIDLFAGAGGLSLGFELAMDGDAVKIIEEKHYKLVPYDSISPEELLKYKREA